LVAQIIATALVASFLIFGLLEFAPGDPIRVLTGGRTLTPQATEAIRNQYHLGDPFLERYWLWLTGILHGDFGQSIVFHEPVSDLIVPRLMTTALLVSMASAMIIIGGIALGIVAAKTEPPFHAPLSAVMTVALATPTFVASIVLITFFAANLGWFPVFGPGSGIVGRLDHLFLPAVALALSGSVYVARISDVSMREEFDREYVDTARVRGLSESTIMRRHVLRNALLPIATVSGVTIAGLIAGTVVVETAFGLNGLGSLLVQSVEQNDFAVVESLCLIMIVAFIVVNGIVDLLYAIIDPRVRRPVS
jgi:peptide/nickel transport system permease protein